MRILITILFLLSYVSVSMAGIGDDYYCDMKNCVTFKNHQLDHCKIEKFNFFWSSDKKIKFGSENNYFKGVIIDLTQSFPSLEQFFGIYGFAGISFKKGNLYWAYSTFNKASAMTATCSILTLPSQQTN